MAYSQCLLLKNQIANMQGAKGINRFRDAMDGDDSSTASFPMSLKPPRPHTKRAWTGGTKVRNPDLAG